MNDLPITNCNNCGACCFEQGSPPGYSTVILNPENWPQWTGDHARVAALPDDARASLLDGMGEDPNGPCCWLDQATMRCRWYEHRPQICRDVDRGSEGCRVWRDEYNIDVESLKG